MFTIVWAGECWLVDDGSSFIDLIFDLGMFNCSNEGLVVYRGGLIRVTFGADMIEGWGGTVHSIVVSWVKRHVCILFSWHLPKSVWFLHGMSHTVDHTDMFEESDLRSLQLRDLSWLSVQYVDQKAVSPIAQMTILMDPESWQVGSWIALYLDLITSNL